ncbi:MAG: hypothetical protein COA73_10775 [Candidatus Hydrogenedentota bacterium]|nr:MAG: hypothetical protein COA73_10775 [Candidatus Hydrogenedentota bacterium]
MDAVEEELKRTHGKVVMEVTFEDPMAAEFNVDDFLIESKLVNRVVYQWHNLKYRCELYEDDDLLRTIIHDGFYTDLGNGYIFTEEFVNALTFDDNIPDEDLYLDGIRYVSYIDTHLFSLTQKDRVTNVYEHMRFTFPDTPNPAQNEIAVNAYPNVSGFTFYWPYRFEALVPHDIKSTGYNSGTEMFYDTMFADYFELDGKRLPATCSYYSTNTLMSTTRLLPEGCNLSEIPDNNLFIIDIEGKEIYGSPRWKNYTRYGAAAIAIVILGTGIYSLFRRKEYDDI